MWMTFGEELAVREATRRIKPIEDRDRRAAAARAEIGLLFGRSSRARRAGMVRLVLRGAAE